MIPDLGSDHVTLQSCVATEIDRTSAILSFKIGDVVAKKTTSECRIQSPCILVEATRLGE